MITEQARADSDEHGASTPAAAWPTGSPGWLSAAAILIRAAMLADGRYAIDSCVNAARIGVDVLRHFGVTARPLAAQTLISTDDAWAWHTEHGWDDKAPVGHLLGIGFRGEDPGPTHWDGHLVLLTRTHLLDLSLDQAERPEHGVRITGPLVDEIAPDWPGSGDWAVFRDDRHPTVVAYRPMVGDRATRWRRFSGWTAHNPTRRDTVGDAIRAIREISA